MNPQSQKSKEYIMMRMSKDLQSVAEVSEDNFTHLSNQIDV